MTAMRVDDGFVPLAIAARLAYYEITPPIAQVSGQKALTALIPGVVLSLSSLAGIYYRASREEPATLVPPDNLPRLLRQHRASPRLDVEHRLFMRRSDLHRAIASLKASGTSFGPKASVSRPSASRTRRGLAR